MEVFEDKAAQSHAVQKSEDNNKENKVRMNDAKASDEGMFDKIEEYSVLCQ